MENRGSPLLEYEAARKLKPRLGGCQPVDP
jgi:hypothetical protein